jgi:glycosyltransferase involved in cell wall biosynthesis
VLDAARLCGAQDGIHFVIAGAGADSDRLQRQAQHLQLKNVTFLDPIPKRRMPGLINAADCVVVPLRNLEIFRGALPTKMFEAMACAKPVVLGISGEAEQVMRASNAGCWVPPEEPSAIRDAVMMLNADREHARRLGENGRTYAVREFSRETRARELNDTLCSFLRLPFKEPPTAVSGDTCPLQFAADTQEKERI